MSFNDLEHLTSEHLDILREIGNIGSGNAATSLALMLDTKIDIEVPTVQILDYSTVVDKLGGPENLLLGLLICLEGDVRGMIMFLINKSFAHMLLQELTGTVVNDDMDIAEFERSAIQEVGNIMAAAYIRAICELTGLVIDISTPSLAVDMTGAILSVPAIYFADPSDKIVFIEDNFNQLGDIGGSQILLILETESLEEIMRSLGIDG